MLIRPIFETNPNYDQSRPYTIPNSFTLEELDWIQDLTNSYSYTDGVINSDDNPLNENVRKSRIKWISYSDISGWLYDKIYPLIMEANSMLWGFTLASIDDSIQYTEYYENGGHYDWHMDMGSFPQNNRKISITIQLSDPNTYEGGDFEFWVNNAPWKAPKEQRLAILFPSYLMHRVTPVTKGTRKSLVLWVGGTTFH
jgi:PKHD-type hydroxylase